MDEYFKPLRRKIGVVTLGFACASMIEWVRSPTQCDVIAVLTNHKFDHHSLMSSKMGLSYVRTHMDFSTEQQIQFASYAWPFKSGEDFFTHAGMSWKVDLYGHRFGDNRSFSRKGDTYCVVGTVPHLSIVAPLTLLSAWLLLSKFRPKPELNLNSDSTSVIP